MHLKHYMPCASSLSSFMLFFAFSLFLSLFMKWFLQLADLSSQFNARHFSSDSLHALPFSLHPLIFLPPSFHPPLSIYLTHSFSLFFTLSCSLTLHLLFFDLLGPSVLSLTALHRRLGWKEEKKSAKLLQGFEQGRRNSPSHTQEKKMSQQKWNWF